MSDTPYDPNDLPMNVEFECSECYEPILIDYDDSPNKVVCKQCNTAFKVDYDAELVDGSWKDLTKLNSLL